MAECCPQAAPATGAADAHLLVVGGGSAGFAAAIRAAELGARVTIINAGLPVGGTCVNVGCVPSKTLLRAAEAHHRAARHPFAGIESRSRLADFGAVMRQQRELVTQLRRARYLEVLAALPQVRLVEGRARLLSARTVEVNGRRLSGERLLVATGAAPDLPPIPGLAEADCLTSQSALELNQLPESLIVLGGRFVALECAQMFARFGTRVTLLQRSARILPSEAADLTDALTALLRAEGIEVVTGVTVRTVRRSAGLAIVEAEVGRTPRRFRARHLLAATGRRPNTRDLGLENAGIRLGPRGFVLVDDTLQTSAAGVYAAGDVIGSPQFVYAAAYEGALAADNALGLAGRRRDYTALPWVIFTDPQICGVGLDEQQARARGIDADVAVLPLSHVPRALAARDTRGLIKLIRQRGSDRLVGGRILAPEGSELLMELSLAIRFGITVAELRDCFHPYLTLSEGVKLAALAFTRDVARLSCCAT